MSVPDMRSKCIGRNGKATTTSGSSRSRSLFGTDPTLTTPTWTLPKCAGEYKRICARYKRIYLDLRALADCDARVAVEREVDGVCLRVRSLHVHARPKSARDFRKMPESAAQGPKSGPTTSSLFTARNKNQKEKPLAHEMTAWTSADARVGAEKAL
eukprot:3734612-Rhodomonas_salina.1